MRARAVILVFSLGAFALGACAGLVGIEELGVDAPPISVDGAITDAPLEGRADVALLDAAEAAVDAGSKRVFVTSDLENGAMGGVAGADARCAAAAARGGLDGGAWVAWVSASAANAVDRIEHPGAYLLLDGRRVVASKSQLTTGNLDVAIDITEDNQLVKGSTVVWTGTFPNGQTSVSCNNWTSNGVIVYGAAGSLDRPKNGDWTDNGGPSPAQGFPNWGCQTAGRLYCFER